MDNRNYRARASQATAHRFAMGLFCGAAIGAAVGLLLAPKSGAELRHDLASSADRLRKRVDDGYGQAAEMVEQVVADGTRAIQRGRDVFDRTRADFAEASSRSDL